MPDTPKYTRRGFVSSLGLATTFSLAGCTGQSRDSETSTFPPQTPTDRRTSTEQDTSTATTTVEGVADAKVTKSTLEVKEGEYRTTAAVTGTVENTGTERLRSVAATGKFYDGQDNLLTTRVVKISDLAPGEVWDVFARYVNDASKVKRGELVISQAAATPRTYFPDGFTVTKSDMEVPQEGNRPVISAMIQNSSGIDDAFLMAVPKVYAKNGNVLGTAITSKGGLSDGGTWNLNSRVRIPNSEWVDRASDHKVVLLR